MKLTDIEKTAIAVSLRASADLARITGKDEEGASELEVLAYKVEHGPDDEGAERASDR
jgi:hypothetical protein